MTHEVQETLIAALQQQQEEANKGIGITESELHAARLLVEALEADYGRHRRKYDEILNALQFVLNAEPSS